MTGGLAAAVDDAVTDTVALVDGLHQVVARLSGQLADEQSVTACLRHALDSRRPPLDPARLGVLLRTVSAGRRRAPGRAGLDDLWTALAEAAIDHCRGLWPSGVHPDGAEAIGDELEWAILWPAGDPAARVETHPTRAAAAAALRAHPDQGGRLVARHREWSWVPVDDGGGRR